VTARSFQKRIGSPVTTGTAEAAPLAVTNIAASAVE